MMIVLRYQDGLLTEVGEAREVDEKQLPTLRAEAEKNRKTLEEADSRRRKELLDKMDERNKERAKEAYYDTSRAVALINLMLHEYQDGKIEQGEKDEALAFLGELRGGKTVKEALGKHLAVKVEYEALYGRID